MVFSLCHLYIACEQSHKLEHYYEYIYIFLLTRSFSTILAYFLIFFSKIEKNFSACCPSLLKSNSLF
ncbi:hypothetical protein C2G38_203623 [Gigaspora rosea]|uniref:Uncharacterized protein n=1 Tax=Gigaspora rosea TaxID=44941 RepID=A0A397UST9_9GLOM|nr:hypothetical protein C2G38_203623 [Gigaspora rosea]